jgi:DNA-binding transcriptional regulator YhcF (GntR family)
VHPVRPVLLDLDPTGHPRTVSRPRASRPRRSILATGESDLNTTPLNIRISEDGPPPYEQLAERLRSQIERGRLLPGDRLPPVRDLAERLGLAPNTVARAYRVLGEDGWIEGHGRAGTFVTSTPPIRPGDRSAELEDAARNYLRRAAQLGFDRSAAVRALRRT